MKARHLRHLLAPPLPTPGSLSTAPNSSFDPRRASCDSPNKDSIVTMKIDFPKVSPDIASSLEGAKVVNIISFPVIVDGRRFLSDITFQALIEHFGAASEASTEIKQAFESGRERIHAATREQLATNGARAVHLTVRDF
jgi:hypothetical protein